MNIASWMWSLLGGVIIGIAVTLILLLKGRVFGVSGIFAGALIPKKGDFAWRLASLMGLAASGVVLFFVRTESLVLSSHGSMLRYVTAGVLVGFGTQLGGGCTSGHGVCGLSRLSRRSIVATLMFMGGGMGVVAILRALGILL